MKARHLALLALPFMMIQRFGHNEDRDLAPFEGKMSQQEAEYDHCHKMSRKNIKESKLYCACLAFVIERDKHRFPKINLETKP